MSRPPSSASISDRSTQSLNDFHCKHANSGRHLDNNSTIGAFLCLVWCAKLTTRQNVNDIDRLLGAIYGHVQSNHEMADDLKHTIKRKRAQREAQMQKLLDYGGPDKETRSILDQSSFEWSMNPQKFWERVGSRSNTQPDPQAEVVCSFLHATGDGA